MWHRGYRLIVEHFPHVLGITGFARQLFARRLSVRWAANVRTATVRVAVHPGHRRVTCNWAVVQSAQQRDCARWQSSRLRKSAQAIFVRFRCGLPRPSVTARLWVLPSESVSLGAAETGTSDSLAGSNRLAVRSLQSFSDWSQTDQAAVFQSTLPKPSSQRSTQCVDESGMGLEKRT